MVFIQNTFSKRYFGKGVEMIKEDKLYRDMLNISAISQPELVIKPAQYRVT
jgi:hypothetical protein